LRDWSNFYADRWQVDARDLTSETYGADAISMPSELQHRVSLLHEIAERLDRMLPLNGQRTYWHSTTVTGDRPPASRLSARAWGQ
jgi:hypothetical protein